MLAVFRPRLLVSRLLGIALQLLLHVRRPASPLVHSHCTIRRALGAQRVL
jgi:hypothetical protein